MANKIKFPLFLLYFVFIFPLLLSIALNAPSSSRIVSGSLSIRNYGEIISIIFCIFYILTNNKNFYIFFLKNNLLKPFFLLSGLYLISTIWSDSKLLTFFRATEFFVIGLISLYVYNGFCNINDKFNHKGLRNYLLHITLIGILYVFSKKIAFSEILIKQNFLADNALSLLLAGSFLICFYQQIKLNEKNKMFIFLFFAFIYLSYSLTSIITILICLTYLYTSKFNNKKKYIFLFSILILMFFYFFLSEIKFINQILSYISFRPIERIESLTGRENIWKLIIIELDGKFFGSGFATDQYLLLDRMRNFEVSSISSGHNVYLESYIASKWLGILLLLYSFYFWFRKANICFQKEHSNLVEALIVFAIISGFTSSGYGGSMVSHPYILFWVTFTPLMIATNNEKK
mgnify:CR=1 FL=1